VRGIAALTSRAHALTNRAPTYFVVPVSLDRGAVLAVRMAVAQELERVFRLFRQGTTEGPAAERGRPQAADGFDPVIFAYGGAAATPRGNSVVLTAGSASSTSQPSSSMPEEAAAADAIDRDAVIARFLDVVADSYTAGDTSTFRATINAILGATNGRRAAESPTNDEGRG